MSHSGNKLIEARRKADNAYREMDSAVADNMRVKQYARFENESAAKITHQLKQVLCKALDLAGILLPFTPPKALLSITCCD